MMRFHRFSEALQRHLKGGKSLSAVDTYLLDEPKVVADEHDAAVKLVDGLGQHVDGLDVQVVGGLIQEEHVRVLPGQPGEAHAALLPI